MSSRPKFHIKRGDIVEVISGNHRGSSGKVLQIIPAKSQVIIEGVRMIKKTQRKTQENPNGSILEREGPLHISNVKLTDAPAKDKKDKKKPAKKETAKKKAA